MTKKIMTIGELLIDFIPEQKGCALKDVSVFTRAAGGAPGNVACAAARLGAPVQMISQVGTDAFGSHIIEMLAACGVDVSYIFRTDKAKTGLAFVSLTESGDRDFSFYREPSADLFLEENQISQDMFQDCTVLHFGSVNLVDAPARKAHEKAICCARECGALISFDPNVRLPLWKTPEACKQAILDFLPYADIVKLSDNELDFVTGKEQPDKAAELLLSHGVKLVVCTLGAKGACAFTKDGGVWAESPRVQAVDSTGAGDSFDGAFLVRLLQTGVARDDLSKIPLPELEQHIRFAVVYAAHTVTQKGGISAMADREQLVEFQKRLAAEQTGDAMNGLS